MKLPKTIPILQPEQFCKGRLNGPDGTHCLWGWAMTLFPEVERWPVEQSLMQVAGDYIPEFNDRWYRRKKTLAAVWQSAMEKLGYVRDGTVNRLRAERAKVEA